MQESRNIEAGEKRLTDVTTSIKKWGKCIERTEKLRSNRCIDKVG